VQSVQNLNCGPKTFLNSQTKTFPNNILSTNNNYQPMQCNAIQKTQQSLNNKQVRKVYKVLLSSKKSTTSLLSSSSSSYTQKFQTKSK